MPVRHKTEWVRVTEFTLFCMENLMCDKFATGRNIIWTGLPQVRTKACFCVAYGSVRTVHRTITDHRKGGRCTLVSASSRMIPAEYPTAIDGDTRDCFARLCGSTDFDTCWTRRWPIWLYRSIGAQDMSGIFPIIRASRVSIRFRKGNGLHTSSPPHLSHRISVVSAPVDAAPWTRWRWYVMTA